ncbi:MAG: HEAT repeat domain-containing protein [Planctomycetota bacterium]
MRLSLLLVLLSLSPVFAQGMPRASEADAWESLYNKKRLRMTWELPPSYAPTKLPDGTEEPPRAPWPFLIYVHENDATKAYERLRKNILNDTRFVVACQAVRPIEIRPDQVISLPYLSGVQGIRDPTLIVLDRDFNVVGSIHRPKEFEAKLFFPLLIKAANREYKIPLPKYVGKFIKLLHEGEKLWKEGREIDHIRSKAVEAIEKGDQPKAKKLDAQADAREAALENARAELSERVQAVRDSLVLKGANKQALPTAEKGKPALTPAEREAIRTYRTFARNKNPVVRAAAVEDLGSIDSAAIVDTILIAANDTDRRVVDAAGRALGMMKSPEALQAMHAGLASSKARVRLAALLGFARVRARHAPAVPRLVESLRKGDEETRRAAIRALENQGDLEATDALVAALQDKRPGLRVMAAHALGRLEATGAVAALVACLVAPDWPLRKAAAEALGRIRAKESIAPLLLRLEQEEGLQKEVVLKALVAITGQDFRYRVENWRRWWDRYGEGFEVPSKLAIADAKKRAARALEGYAKPDKRRYHKIETLSRRMVFVVDISASMQNKIVLPPGLPPEREKEFESRVKIDIAKKELIDVLAGLDKHVHFNIITFAGEAKAWQKRLVPGTRRNAAIKFVSRLEPMKADKQSGKRGKISGDDERQKTNTYAALMAAFGLSDEPVPNWTARGSRPDTIFLVTDGLPTTGRIVDVDKLVNTVTELNRTRNAVIHVIVFDKDAVRKLKPLAERNGGQCLLRGY